MIALYPMKTLMNLSSGASIKYLFELLVCCCQIWWCLLYYTLSLSPSFFFLSFSFSITCLMRYSLFILCLHEFTCVFNNRGVWPIWCVPWLIPWNTCQVPPATNAKLAITDGRKSTRVLFLASVGIWTWDLVYSRVLIYGFSYIYTFIWFHTYPLELLPKW